MGDFLSCEKLRLILKQKQTRILKTLPIIIYVSTRPPQSIILAVSMSLCVISCKFSAPVNYLSLLVILSLLLSDP